MSTFNSLCQIVWVPNCLGTELSYNLWCQPRWRWTNEECWRRNCWRRRGRRWWWGDVHKFEIRIIWSSVLCIKCHALDIMTYLIFWGCEVVPEDEWHYIYGVRPNHLNRQMHRASGGGESLIHYPPLSFCLHHQSSHAISYFTPHDKKNL